VEVLNHLSVLFDGILIEHCIIILTQLACVDNLIEWKILFIKCRTW